MNTSQTPDSSPTETPIPWLESLTIGQVLRGTAGKIPNHDAAVFSSLNWRRTWAEFDQEVDRVARALLATGLQRGDLIIRGGENIYPREIEDVLYQHSAFQDVQIIGIPNRKLGEAVMAWVQFRAGMLASEDELRAFCKERAAHFKIPQYWKFVESFPTTVTGKIQKFRMREISIQELGLQEIADLSTA